MRLLAGGLDPHLAVLGYLQILGRQAAHIPVRDTRVAGEEEEVADVVEFRIVQGCGHQPLQLRGGKVFLFPLGAFGLVPGERVGGDDPLGDGLADNRVQARGERHDGSRREAALRAQVEVVPVDERAVERREGNIRKFIDRLHEAGDTIAGVAVVIERAFFAVHAHAFLEVFDKGAEITEQALLAGGHAQQLFPYLFGGHDLPYGRLLLVDGQRRGAQLVQLPVDFLRGDAFAFGAARSPQRGGNRHLRAEGRRGIASDGKLRRDGAATLGVHLAPFKVERNLYIRLFHNSTFQCYKFT